MSHRNLFKVDQRASQANFQPIRTTAGERRHQQSLMVNQHHAKASQERRGGLSLLCSSLDEKHSPAAVYITDASSIYKNLYRGRHFVFKGAAASLAGRYIQTTLIIRILGLRLSWKPTKMDSRDEVISRMRADDFDLSRWCFVH